MKYLYPEHKVDKTIEVMYHGAKYQCKFNMEGELSIYPTPKYRSQMVDIYNEAIKTVNRTVLDDIEELITKLKAY